MDGINALILEAQDVKTALSEAKQIIERNLLSSAEMFVETSATAAIKNRLNNINNRMRGYSQLALEFMELAQDQAIVSDQGMVQELLDAFDELVTQVEGDIARLTQQIVTDTNTYNT